MSRCGDCELKDCELNDVGSYECIEKLNDQILDLEAKLQEVLTADRPQGKVNAVKVYEQASHDLEFGYITLGEFEERIEPLKHLYYDRPQGKWIPCSERLPSENGDYLVTLENGVVKILGYSTTQRTTYPKGFYHIKDGFSWRQMQNPVIAWMLLPKPWKGADDE